MPQLGMTFKDTAIQTDTGSCTNGYGQGETYETRIDSGVSGACPVNSLAYITNSIFHLQ